MGDKPTQRASNNVDANTRADVDAATDEYVLAQSDAEAAQLPTAFITRLRDALGSTDADLVCEQLISPTRVGLRINWLRCSTAPDVASAVARCAETLANTLAELPSAVEPIAGLQDVFAAPASMRAALTASAPFVDGRLWLQNPSSVLAVLALDPQPGEEILDLAAAPGMKTLHIAALMGNTGRIGAVEAIKPRFFRLRDVLQRGGATMVQTYLADGRTIGRKTPERFDRVLLDAPCSSEARFLRDVPASMGHWSEHKVRDCARKQRGLLWSAFAALKPGGQLVYSTCSFAPEENEGSIAWLLERAGGAAQVLPWTASAGDVRPGLTRFRREAWPDALRACVRVLPDGLFGGFFIAVIGKAVI